MDENYRTDDDITEEPITEDPIMNADIDYAESNDIDILLEPEPEVKKSIGSKLEDKLFGLISKFKGKKNKSGRVVDATVSEKKPDDTKTSNNSQSVESTPNNTNIPIPQKHPFLNFFKNHKLHIPTFSAVTPDDITNCSKWTKAISCAVSTIALVAFAIGAFCIYSNLPTHPDLVIGIIILSASSSILVSNMR